MCVRAHAGADGKERTLPQRRKKQLCHFVVRVCGLCPEKNLWNSGAYSRPSVSIIFPYSQSVGLREVVTWLKLGVVCPALVLLA